MNTGVRNLPNDRVPYTRRPAGPKTPAPAPGAGRPPRPGRRKRPDPRRRAVALGALCVLAVALTVLIVFLAGRDRGELVFVRQPQPLPEGGGYRLRHPPQRLYDAYRDAIGRGRRRLPPPARAFSALVARRLVSVDSRIVHLLRGLYPTCSASYESLFADSRDRQELVATFLAVLELVKAQRITLEGERVRLERGHRRAAPAREEEAP